MSNIKKWSYGSLGNENTGTQNNPNTKGLDVSGLPGIEGYIEEDDVIASVDNRPLINLAENDEIISANASDVASEVDHGVFKNRYDEFEIEILPPDNVIDPESGNSIISNKLRIKSGSSIINGTVTRIGSQKLIYFYRDNGSQLFPDYTEDRLTINIYDDDYFGEYQAVYSVIPEGLNENFNEYKIQITNRDSADPTNPDKTRVVPLYNIYRDWEDIVPYKAHSTIISEEDIDFKNDGNFGQFSDGYWLSSDNTPGTKVTSVEIKKDIIIKDKELNYNDIIVNAETSLHEYPLVTDGLFFDDIKWLSSQEFDSESDIQSMYVHHTNDTYFIQRSETATELFKLSSSSILLESKTIRDGGDAADSVNLGLKQIDDYLFIYGTKGFIKIFDLNATKFTSSTLLLLPNLNIGLEEINDIKVWDRKIWIVTNNSLWYTNYENFDATTAIFTQIDLYNQILDSSSQPIVDRIKNITRVKGNYKIDSSLESNVFNKLLNPSLEFGALDGLPNEWTVGDDANNDSTFEKKAGGVYGNYLGELVTNIVAGESNISQIVMLDEKSDTYTLSASLLTNSATNEVVTYRIEELDNDLNILNTSEYIDVQVESNVTGILARRSETFTIVNEATTKIRIIIASLLNSTKSIYIDNIQFEVGDVMSQYVESFDYLLIGFRKLSTNLVDPPFAIIDREDKYTIQYSRGLYGEIESINGAISSGYNEVKFITDNRLYSLKLLNNYGEYDKLSCTSLDNNGNLDFSRNIERFETIKKFGDRIFFGGTVKNNVIKFKALPSVPGNNLIEFLPVEGAKSLVDILGSSSFIAPQSEDLLSIRQFDTIDDLYENVGVEDVVGRYTPDSIYYLIVTFNDVEVTLNVTSPAKNVGPWTIEQIRNELTDLISFETIDLEVLPLPLLQQTQPYSEWVKPNSSLSKIDGFYSIGKNDITNHIRGDIHEIFIQENNTESFYIIRNSQIFKTKYDTNIIKEGDVYNDIDWKLYDDEYSLNQFIDNININEDENSNLIRFNDDSTNTSPISIPVKEGYALLKGSLRVKSNDITEVGFVENKDYFVDYDNATIIRNSGNNILLNSKFDYGIQDWLFRDEDVASDFKVIAEDSWFTNNKVQTYKSSTSQYTDIYQINQPAQLDVGDTYVFSIYAKASNVISSNYIQITECNVTNESVFDTIDSLEQTKADMVIDDDLNEWIRFDVSHTITNAASDRLRVEIRNVSGNNFYITKVQLEKNNQLTPYIDGLGYTNIVADMQIYLDYTESKILNAGIDYTFDSEDRKVIFNIWPTENEENYSYFLSYKYEKIFSPYTFGNTLPILAEQPDSRDDYFLFELEGRIWAINQMFAMLSFDEDNPITISYNYHYPRIDQIKVRNEADEYGNFIYIVKGQYESNNPQKPHDLGLTGDEGWSIYNVGIDTDEYMSRLANTETSDDPNAEDSQTIYEINVFSDDYTGNDIYNRRIYIDARDNLNYNISLHPETLAYFPFTRDFNSTNGLVPLNQLTQSKIVPIIKNYKILQNEEVGAWHEGYRINLRNQADMLYPAGTFSIHVDSVLGDDTDTGETINQPVRTIEKALELVTVDKPNIIIISESSIYEDIEINKPFTVKIFTQSYCYFRGNIQNLTTVYIQGVWFQHANIYPYAKINLYYNTFEASSISCIFPQEINLKNSEFDTCTNSIIRVKDELFPSPFRHPYEAFPLRDDSIDNIVNPTSATSDEESIAPGDSWYDSNVSMQDQPKGKYIFTRCLIHDSSDSIIKYDPAPNWLSQFSFDFCTIANNASLFETQKEGLEIYYNNSILYKNEDTRITLDGEKTKPFDSNSDISFNTCFIDFGTDDESLYNYGSGQLVNRETCIGKESTSNPDFVGYVTGIFDYHLKSIARGYAIDSICTDIATGKDLGAYDEIREQTQQNIPKKLRSYVAFINEGLQYGIVLNSEKITVTLEFKPVSVVTQPGILFDTRSHITDTDYIILAYNNNLPTNHDILQDPNNSPENPYYFRVIVANEEKSYAILSPVTIQSDEDFQKWHRISFTVNYEKIYNTKSGFSNKDTQQNIVTLYHNDAISIESFVKYDLNRYINGELIDGLGGEGTNAWDYNNISNYISIGSDFLGENILSGYYTEFRIDNRFIDRKQFELWNVKEVPFSDPYTHVNQTSLAKTLDPKLLNEYWSLKSDTITGAKNNKFRDESTYNIMYDDSEITWALISNSDNIILDSGFENSHNANIVSGIIDWSNPIAFTSNWNLSVDTNSVTPRRPDDEVGNGGIDLNMTGETVVSQQELKDLLDTKFAALVNPTSITYRFLASGALEFYTTDYGPVNTTMDFRGSFGTADRIALGFATDIIIGTKTYNEWNVAGELNESNVDTRLIYTTKIDDEILNSNTSIVIDKQDSGIAITDTISLYQANTLSDDENYTYSVYVKYDGILNNDLIRFYNEGVWDEEFTFESIEKYNGDWWKCVKHLNLAGGTYNFGVTVISQAKVIIDVTQLEKRYFSGPYVDGLNNINNRLIVPTNILSRDKGIIFYKFKPLFDYYETDEKYLLEILSKNELDAKALDNSYNINYNMGFKITYKFDEVIGRGIIRFINNDEINAEWKVEAIDRFWNQWHSIGLMYDFDNNQFSYIFDHQHITYDVGFSEAFNPTDIYIGSGYWEDPTRLEALKSANIEIKNLIITNYPISDSEMTNWVNTFEFYNESQLNNNIYNQANKIKDLVLSSNASSASLIDLSNRVDTNEITISNMESEHTIINSRLTTNENDIVNITNEASALQLDVTSIEDHIYYVNGALTDTSIDSKLEYMQDGGNSNWAMENSLSKPTGNGENIFDLRTDIDSFQGQITAEASSRAIADQLIIDNLANDSDPTLGAELIGIADTYIRFTGSTVKTILEELAGDGRTTESIMQNSLDIAGISISVVTDIENMKDGNGINGTWTAIAAQNDGYNIYDIKVLADAHTVDITAIENTITSTAIIIQQEISDRVDGDDEIVSTLISNLAGEGASTIGISNSGIFAAITVEAALIELAGVGRSSLMTVFNNYNSIVDISGVGRIDETIKGNADNISTLEINSDALSAYVGQMADGLDGAMWTDPTWNLVTHETRIDSLESEMSVVQPQVGVNTIAIGTNQTNIGLNTTAIGDEITNRTNADTLIRSDLASFIDPAKGALLVGVYDGAGNFTNDNVETVLAELSDKLAALAGALSWQASVADYASLPLVDNNLGDARTVMDDGDGKAAQYIWDGTQWIKVADIDWGNANSISFDNTVSELVATDVQNAIDELATRPADDVSKAEDVALIGDWIYDGENYYYDIIHELGTEDVVCMVMDSTTNLIVGVEEFERIDDQTLRVFLSEPLALDFTIWGVVKTYSAVVNTWIPDGSRYYNDITHGFTTKKLMVSAFDIVTGDMTGMDDVEYINDEVIRVWADTNTTTTNIFILKSSQTSISKDLANWTSDGQGYYESTIGISNGYDAVYEFFDTTTMKNIGVDKVNIIDGTLTVRKSNNNPIRMIILT